MYQTQLLKIRIRPGKTKQVVEFLQRLMDRKDESLEALRREGMMVESMFLEQRDEADFLYYYVKSKDLAHSTQVNMQATDPLTLEIRQFVSETWADVASPEPLLDLDLIPEETPKPRPRRKRRMAGPAAPRDGEGSSASAPPGSGAIPPHALTGP
jgi:hypothetical protein